jgi:hypothetical protein
MALSVTGTSLEGLVQGFYDEIVDVQWNAGDRIVTAKVYSDWQYCESPAHGKCQISHYTQLVWAETNRVGCGWARCDYVSLLGLGGEFLVCKYSPGGNLDDGHGNIYAPFQVGYPGAACSSPGKLCAPGDKPNRCRDELGYNMLEVYINDDLYTDCASLIQGFKEYGNWCSDFAMANAPRHWCDFSCHECSVPANVGASYCPGSYVAESNRNLTNATHGFQGKLIVPKHRKVHYTIAPHIRLGDSRHDNGIQNEGGSYLNGSTNKHGLRGKQ